jgi:hypothetical protein
MYIVELLAITGRKEQSVELNSLIQQPPNIDQFYDYAKGRLQNQIEDLRTALSPEVFQAAWERGKSLDLDVTVASLLGETEQSRWSLVGGYRHLQE